MWTHWKRQISEICNSRFFRLALLQLGAREERGITTAWREDFSGLESHTLWPAVGP